MKPVRKKLVRRKLLQPEKLNWDQFLHFIHRYGSQDRIWRGVANANGHRLRPSIGRKEPYDEIVEKELFREFRRRARQFDATHQFTLWDLIAMAQHHGLPTRLIDWTYNPLVAAYFAVTSSPEKAKGKITCILKPPEVDLDSDPDPFEVREVLLFRSDIVSPRIVAQEGVFTIHPNPDARAWQVPKALDRQDFPIKSEYKSYFKSRLADLGIDAAHMMADIDGLCRAIKEKYI